jgi:chemotaxis protein MotB
MALKRERAGGHESHERWLVSYADFITLLFAFFVVMFASAQADKSKAKAVSESVRDALEHGQFVAAISTALGRGRHQASDPLRDKPRVEGKENIPLYAAPAALPQADLQKSKAKLEVGLGTELSGGKIELKLENRGLVISLREATFFASGDDTVQPSSFPILDKVAAVIAELPNQVRLEGHTDSKPIHTSRFRSNWELSTARAIRVMELLRQRFQIPAERLSVAGYAENAPADTNDTEEGRAHNRRVDVVLLSEEGQKFEPQPAGPRPTAPLARK